MCHHLPVRHLQQIGWQISRSSCKGRASGLPFGPLLVAPGLAPPSVERDTQLAPGFAPSQQPVEEISALSQGTGDFRLHCCGQHLLQQPRVVGGLRLVARSAKVEVGQGWLVGWWAGRDAHSL